MFILLFYHHLAFPHSGGTDRHGCHAGSQPYHCHNSGYEYSENDYEYHDYSSESQYIYQGVDCSKTERPDDCWHEQTYGFHTRRYTPPQTDSHQNNDVKQTDDGWGGMVVGGLFVLGMFCGFIKFFGWVQYFVTGDVAIKKSEYFTKTGFWLVILLFGWLVVHLF